MRFTTSGAFKKIKTDQWIKISPKELNKIQEVLLSMLDDVLDVCNSYGIDYALCGGSALGAVRHKGFIPWDDDIDLCMPRKAYERFVPLFRERYGNKYWIQTPETTKGYALLMAKIRKKGTVYRTRDDFGSLECGIPIDLFIVEDTYDFLLWRVLQGVGSFYYAFALSCRKFYRDRQNLLLLVQGDDKLTRMINLKAMIGRGLAVFGSVDQWRMRALHHASKCRNPESKYVTTPSGTLQFFKETFRREDYCRYRKEKFEGRIVQIPLHEELFFKRCYGDWERIPQESEIEQHRLIELKI